MRKNYFKSKFFEHLTIALCFFSALSSYAQTTYNIDDPEDLRNVIYSPGDEIILKNGTYTTDERMRFFGSGTAENPVIFRAETPGGVIFTGGARLSIGGEDEDGVKIATGEYLIVDGFHWKGGYGASTFIEFRNGSENAAHHSTIQNCVIDGLGVDPDELAEDLADEQIPKHNWVVLYGTHNTVINCSFMNKVTAGNIVLGEYAYNAFPDEDDDNLNTSCIEVGHKIMNNYFFNYEKVTELYGQKENGDDLSNSGDSETIRLGTSSYQMVNSNGIVSNNYFVQADGENEIITNKSKGNTYTNNTFRRCRGSLVLRHGSYGTVDGNYFLGEDVDGTGGIRIVDSEHTITNNYIQDCVTIESNAKWNNGFTFLGGSANADVDCATDDVSNGYQKVVNINVANNTLVNTNAPLFYNEDKGSTDPTGTFTNNLIYFTDADPNLTAVISGDSETAFNNLGTKLTYSGNVFTGTSLGATTTGFSEESGITATASGEIFTFSGATGKGADMGTYEPATDAMVGYGIGACFIDYTGSSIIDGNCTIQISESISVSGLTSLSAEAADYDVTVTANVGWTAISNNDWITIDTNSAAGDATVSVSVTKNESSETRTGTVTFTQVAGGDDIIKTLTVTQEGADLTSLYTLINTGTGLDTDKVTVHSFSKQNDSKSPPELAIHSLDKDLDTEWTAEDGAILSGDFKGDGEYVIYDLGDEYNLDLIRFNTTSKSDAFGVQILVSTTGTEAADFTQILPTSGDILFSATNTTDFNNYEIDTDAKYVKLIGFGRFNEAGDNRESAWTAITEIEFYGESTSLSVNDFSTKDFSVYPNPVNNNSLFIKTASTDFNQVNIYTLLGQKILETKLTSNSTISKIDVSALNSGIYFVELSNGKQKAIKKIIVTE
ncbi:chondroitinase-B domain-containing protein [Polaribacter sp. Asnod6-C07]|uniref:chondroitinase-B domain-containing protein n=1 Tax=Polaribacter sp. Asnod6-C07 TaxID=3160582 RepID=UPI00386321BA